MIIEASNIPLPLDAGLPGGEGLIREAAARFLGVDEEAIGDIRLLRRSIDARKGKVRFIATLAITLEGAGVDLRDIRPSKGVAVKEYLPEKPLMIERRGLPPHRPRPVVVGTGPAGLFAALYLARAGLRPLVVERGGTVEERQEKVAAFNEGAVLDPATNIQFGEGGAGTFSDGKLTTGTKSPLSRDVLRWFVEAGAPEEILWQAKPHIGTDHLTTVVGSLRRAIEEAGGTVLFHTRLEDVIFDDGHLAEIILRIQDRSALGALEAAVPEADGVGDEPDLAAIPCDALVLACGHSARDTFRMLQRAGLAMESKPFSVGVRIEHLQEDIDRAQYGTAAGHDALGAADYKLVAHLPSGRSVYSFCMCPGGTVVAAASEEFGVVVNGMSSFERDGANANAALLVGVTPNDFPSADPLAGMVFQRRLEQAAYGEAHEDGGEPWQAPAQTVGDFLNEEAGHPSTKVKPTYARGVVWSDLREVLPTFVVEALSEAIPVLGRKLKGFDDPEAVMTGVETRSSSPVRILRDPDSRQAFLQAPKRKVRPRDAARGHGGPAGGEILHRDIGIFPCGEGPGYAGGIMSSAVDGLEVAQAVADYLEG